MVISAKVAHRLELQKRKQVNVHEDQVATLAQEKMTPARDPKQVTFSPFWRVLGRGTGPRGEKMAAARPGVDSQDVATILDPFRIIFVDLGPGRRTET